MVNLQEITENTCVHALRLIPRARVSEDEEKCKFNCTEANYSSCARYLRVGNTQTRYSHLRLYEVVR